jgi:hypothetical protein
MFWVFRKSAVDSPRWSGEGVEIGLDRRGFEDLFVGVRMGFGLWESRLEDFF